MIRLKQIVAFPAILAVSVSVVSAVCILAVSVCALADCVPDTGQTQSYTDTFGEDSDYTINPQSYTDLGDMVKDNVTGLIWQKATAGPMNWYAAPNYCANLSLGGYTDWRLPTIKELWSIVNSGRYNPTINAN